MSQATRIHHQQKSLRDAFYRVTDAGSILAALWVSAEYAYEVGRDAYLLLGVAAIVGYYVFAELTGMYPFGLRLVPVYPSAEPGRSCAGCRPRRSLGLRHEVPYSGHDLCVGKGLGHEAADASFFGQFPVTRLSAGCQH